MVAQYDGGNVPNHGWSLQAQTPAMNADVLREAHGFQHLRSEHTTVPNLNPLLQHRVEGEDLKGWLRVRIVRRLEAHLLDAHLREEDAHEANEVGEREPAVRHDTLDLVELREMRRVHRLGHISGRYLSSS